jgi:hypothetical protein
LGEYRRRLLFSHPAIFSFLGWNTTRTRRMRCGPLPALFLGRYTLKEVKLKDDDALRDLAASGDARVNSATNPQANYAVEFGHMQAAADGNVYLMRWITPTIFYAISPGGAVVRRFVVDPGDESSASSGESVGN